MKGSIRFNNDIIAEVDVDPSAASGSRLTSCKNLIDGQELGGGGGGGGDYTYIVENESVIFSDNQAIIPNFDESILTDEMPVIIKALTASGIRYSASVFADDELEPGFNPAYLGQYAVAIYKEDGNWIIYSENYLSLTLSIIVDDLGILPISE